MKIELVLANGKKFDLIGAIEADYHNENGNIPFRENIPNPDRVLHNGPLKYHAE